MEGASPETLRVEWTERSDVPEDVARTPLEAYLWILLVGGPPEPVQDEHGQDLLKAA